VLWLCLFVFNLVANYASITSVFFQDPHQTSLHPASGLVTIRITRDQFEAEYPKRREQEIRNELAQTTAPEKEKNVTVQPSAAPTPSVDRDTLFWQSIKSSTNPDDFKSYSRLTQSQRPLEPTGRISSVPVGKQFDCRVPTGIMVRADAHACKNFGGVLMR
jgi:hypothetical protein